MNNTNYLMFNNITSTSSCFSCSVISVLYGLMYKESPTSFLSDSFFLFGFLPVISSILDVFQYMTELLCSSLPVGLLPLNFNSNQHFAFLFMLCGQPFVIIFLLTALANFEFQLL
jgi:hypothetical protein